MAKDKYWNGTEWVQISPSLQEYNDHVKNGSAHGIGNKSLLKTTEKTNIVAAINELFTNANDGKTLVANAVTLKGVAASPSDTFATLATKIGQIFIGKKVATGNYKDSYSQIFGVSGLDFTPLIVFAFPWKHDLNMSDFAFGIHLWQLGHSLHGTRTSFMESNTIGSGIFTSEQGKFYLRARHNNGPVDLLWVAIGE